MKTHKEYKYIELMEVYGNEWYFFNRSEEYYELYNKEENKKWETSWGEL